MLHHICDRPSPSLPLTSATHQPTDDEDDGAGSASSSAAASGADSGAEDDGGAPVLGEPEPLTAVDEKGT